MAATKSQSDEIEIDLVTVRGELRRAAAHVRRLVKRRNRLIIRLNKKRGAEYGYQRRLARLAGLTKSTISTLIKASGGTDDGRVPGAKLTIEDVRSIRQRLELGERPSKVASDFNITRTAVSAIRTRRSWKHVD